MQAAKSREGTTLRRRRCRINRRNEWLTVFALAFGLGLFLAVFCSVRFALFLAAIALIYLGLTFRR